MLDLTDTYSRGPDIFGLFASAGNSGIAFADNCCRFDYAVCHVLSFDRSPDAMAHYCLGLKPSHANAM